MYVTFPIQLNCIVICSAFCSGDEMNQFLASGVIDTCQNIKTDMLSMAFSCSIIYDSVLMSSLNSEGFGGRMHSTHPSVLLSGIAEIFSVIT